MRRINATGKQDILFSVNSGLACHPAMTVRFSRLLACNARTQVSTHSPISQGTTPALVVSASPKNPFCRDRAARPVVAMATPATKLPCQLDQNRMLPRTGAATLSPTPTLAQMALLLHPHLALHPHALPGACGAAMARACCRTATSLRQPPHQSGDLAETRADWSAPAVVPPGTCSARATRSHFTRKLSLRGRTRRALDGCHRLASLTSSGALLVWWRCAGHSWWAHVNCLFLMCCMMHLDWCSMATLRYSLLRG
jgi:hypothetical protein